MKSNEKSINFMTTVNEWRKIDKKKINSVRFLQPEKRAILLHPSVHMHTFIYCDFAHYYFTFKHFLSHELCHHERKMIVRQKFQSVCATMNEHAVSVSLFYTAEAAFISFIQQIFFMCVYFPLCEYKILSVLLLWLR